MPRSVAKAKARQERLRTFRAVDRLPLRWVVEAVVAKLGVHEGTVTLHVKDGNVSMVDRRARLKPALVMGSRNELGVDRIASEGDPVPPSNA